MLGGCSMDPVKVTTSTIEVKVPLLYCPAPPVIIRPVLPIHTMTPEQRSDDGEVAKHYKATIRTLIDHTKNHETALKEYENINISYDDLSKQVQKLDEKSSDQ